MLRERRAARERSELACPARVHSAGKLNAAGAGSRARCVLPLRTDWSRFLVRGALVICLADLSTACAHEPQVESVRRAPTSNRSSIGSGPCHLSQRWCNGDLCHCDILRRPRSGRACRRPMQPLHQLRFLAGDAAGLHQLLARSAAARQPDGNLITRRGARGL